MDAILKMWKLRCMILIIWAVIFISLLIVFTSGIKNCFKEADTDRNAYLLVLEGN